tara:strand:+ start:6867 stop:7295 length:429 start_codon:yes stop_codon:yes gene_type:complete
MNTLETLNMGKITIEECENIFLCLLKQLKELEENKLTIPIYNLKDIVKKGKQYYFSNNSKIFSMDKDMIIINKLFVKNEFTSNEMINIDELPTLIFKTASYWSLGKIIEHCLRGKNIKYSKLSWALKRCLENNPKNRYLIYI